MVFMLLWGVPFLQVANGMSPAAAAAILVIQPAAGIVAGPLIGRLTAAHPLHEVAEVFNPNVVKVVCRADGDAAYFSRAPIPYARDHFAREDGGMTLPAGFPAYRHVGLYAYRASFLKAYAGLSAAPTEHFESLEQLRALWHGYRISVTLIDAAPAPGVDTPEDAERMRKLFDRAGNSE